MSGKSLVQWLRQEEAHVVSEWGRTVHDLGDTEEQQLSTRELNHRIFPAFYDAFMQAATSGKYDVLDEMISSMVKDRVERDHAVEKILRVPLHFRATIWQRLTATLSPAESLVLMLEAEPIFDRSMTILVDTYVRLTRELLQGQLAEAEFLARRLTVATEEVDRAVIQLRTLFNLSRALSSTLDFGALPDLITDTLASLNKVDRCAVWLREPDTGQLVLASARGMESEKLQGITISLDQPACVLCQACLSRQVRVIERVDQNVPLEDDLLPFYQERALLIVPLLSSEEKPLGIIIVDGPSGAQTFDASSVSLVRSMAEQAAIALHNSRLYQEVTRFNRQLERMVQERTEELEKVNRALERLERTKSDFIRIAAHELKTPLTLIQGYANMLKDDSLIANQPRLQAMLLGTFRGAERLKQIIEDMIDVSLIDANVLTLNLLPTSLANVVSLVATDLREAVRERKQTLVIDDNVDVLPYVEADSNRLYQVLLNIVGNAIKYTPDGGKINIWGKYFHDEEDPSGGFVEVAVADTGIGIDPEDQEHIFDKFYRVGNVELHSSGKTKFKGGGPGLGLSIAKGVMEAHGGRVWVESERYDEVNCPGSTFHILLPVKAQPRSPDSVYEVTSVGLTIEDFNIHRKEQK
ncbi:MAG: GAF domain-containing sensor histidine kinase [Chloroflexota bacterium]|nr:GAF domain-containing sensor histidine kinase [Chloroflexota bacterium]